MYELVVLVVALVIIAILTFYVDKYRREVLRLRTSVDVEVRRRFDEWVKQEERRIRDDAIRRSESVIRGKVVEQVVTPYTPWFKYNPRDARFLGTPIDFIVFNGLTEGVVREVVLIEVKSGAHGLSGREESIRKCVEDGRVRYEVIKVNH